MPQSEVYGITTPLLLQSDGQKFGKSLPVSSFGAGGAGGMVWLDAKKTPVYDFYQVRPFSRWMDKREREVVFLESSRSGFTRIVEKANFSPFKRSGSSRQGTSSAFFSPSLSLSLSLS